MMGICKSTPFKLKRAKTKKLEIPISPFDEIDKQNAASIRPRRPKKLSERRNLGGEKQVICPDVVPLNLTVQKRINNLFEESMYHVSDSIGSDSIGRCSTPTDSFCFHCDHYHAEDCCLYVNDTEEDKPRYSRFKQYLEHPSCEPRCNFPLLPDAVSGNSTPPNFPCFTPADPQIFEDKIAKQQIQQHHKEFISNPFISQFPFIYFRQFFYPYTNANQYSSASLPPPQTTAAYHHNHHHPMSSLSQKQQISSKLNPFMTYSHHAHHQILSAPQMHLFPTIYHHEYPHFMHQHQNQQYRQQHTSTTPMTYINTGISLQSQLDLLNHPTLYYQHHQLPQMIPTGFY